MRAIAPVQEMRNAVIGLVTLAFFAAATAGFFGAMLNKNAPVRGGANIILMQSAGHD